MTDIAVISRLVAANRLMVAGIVTDQAALPENSKTLVLLAPDEPSFWPTVKASPEFADGSPDPIERWSERVIGAIADDLGGDPYYPHGGPPYHPFIAWALAGGHVWSSPVSLLVHDQAGLFISFRGAIALPCAVEHSSGSSPCVGCAAPCVTACPSGALSSVGYDVPACHAYLDTTDGQNECLSMGCLVRRACPVGAHRRQPEQSAYHMSLFHR